MKCYREIVADRRSDIAMWAGISSLMLYFLIFVMAETPAAVFTLCFLILSVCMTVRSVRYEQWRAALPSLMDELYGKITA